LIFSIFLFSALILRVILALSVPSAAKRSFSKSIIFYFIFNKISSIYTIILGGTTTCFIFLFTGVLKFYCCIKYFINYS
jgi:hypothetical protein